MEPKDKNSPESFRKLRVSLQDDFIVHLKQIADRGDFEELPF